MKKLTAEQKAKAEAYAAINAIDAEIVKARAAFEKIQAGTESVDWLPTIARWARELQYRPAKWQFARFDGVTTPHIPDVKDRLEIAAAATASWHAATELKHDVRKALEELRAPRDRTLAKAKAHFA